MSKETFREAIADWLEEAMQQVSHTSCHYFRRTKWVKLENGSFTNEDVAVPAWTGAYRRNP